MTRPTRYGSITPKGTYVNIKTGEIVLAGRREDVVYFPSIFEYESYSLLKANFPDADISIHYPLLIKPATRKFPQQHWKVDFRIHQVIDGSRQTNFVEIKGVVTHDFVNMLKYLEMYSAKAYEQLIIVTKVPQYINKHKRSMTIEQAIYQLKQQEF